MSKIIDVCTFNGEYELFEIRYNMLKEYVDELIVCEAPITFSGKEKPLYFEKIKDQYPDVKYHIIDENDDELWEMARNSPNTQGAEHWKREFVHKESIKKALTHLNDEDIVFIGDCDEIWQMPGSFPEPLIGKLKLRVYAYYLNNRSDEEFWGTVVGKYKDIKNECLNHIRSMTGDFKYSMAKSDTYEGWHFTSLAEGLRRKLEDSYTSDSYASPQVMAQLEGNIEQNKDFLGRNFTYTIDESELPEFILQNKDKYSKLFK